MRFGDGYYGPNVYESFETTSDLVDIQLDIAFNCDDNNKKRFEVLSFEVLS
jgi:hypothetical protein